MKLKLAVAAAGWLVTSAPLIAINFWETKDFTAWSDKEVSKMLTDSPWSQKVEILTPDLSLASRVGGLTGGLVGNTVRAGRPSGGGGVGGDGAGNLGGGTFLASPLRTSLVVRLASARPVKQALARQTGTIGDIQGLHESEAVYRVTVVGIPFGQAVGSASGLQDVTRLKRKSRTPIEPVGVTFADERGLLTIEFTFPRSDEITIGDGELEFTTRLVTSELKAKFTLKNLIIGNRLVL